MAKVKQGINIPIIPEDFISSDEEHHTDEIEPLLYMKHTIPYEIDLEDWIFIETLITRYPGK